MEFLKNRSVLVLGLGESGLACARFAVRCGAQLRVADTREDAPGLAAIQALAAQSSLLGTVDIRVGALHPDLLNGITHIVVSPGLSPQRADVAALLAAAHLQNVAVCSELDWFSAALQALKATQHYAPCVLGVTGTNGKTTVTELTAHLCTEAGIQAVACGNISPAALDALMAALDAHAAQPSQPLPAVWVVELSSFQLHYTQHWQPHAATFLNLSQDHLDWHADRAQYAQDKAKVFGTAGASTLRIVNRDDAAVMALANAQSHSFGLDAPTRIGDLGVVQAGGLAWLAAAVHADPDRKLKKGESPEVMVQRLMPAQALRLRGSHNHANALAALMLARAAGVSMAHMLHGLRSFEVAANRCELLHIIHDVEYINDSKGTNVGATVAALNGLGEGRQRLVLLAGGVGKGQDFSPLATAVQAQCKAVVCFGQDGGLIAAALAQSGVPVHPVATLAQATQLAATLASTGDAVLMSPACSSFDQFQNYAHRAQVFRDAVADLMQNAGGIA